MDDNKPTTASMRPLPNRPKYGWSAWEATAGYMSTHHSPDVTLKLTAYPDQDGQKVLWGASLSWAQENEEITGTTAPNDALAQLWKRVDQTHHIFGAVEEAMKRPAHYKEDQWFDNWTLEIMQRLVRVTFTVFKNDWTIVLVYQPVESMDSRIQARLIAADNQVHVGGRGPSLGDGCRQLYHNAAKSYTKYSSSNNQ